MKNTFKKESQSQNLSFMLESPMPKVVLKMAVPTILSMLVMSVYGLSDMFFVSRLGTSASAAVGIVFSIMTMIQAVGFMLGIGAGSLISRSLGAGNKNDAESVVSVTFFSGILGGVLMMILGLFFKSDIMKFLGATETILPYAKDFSHYILLAAPVMCCSFVLNILLRIQGKPTFSMIGLSLGGILNIILEPIFIFGFKLGIGGAAIATLISQFVSFLILLIMYLNNNTFAKIRISLFFRDFFKWFGKICYNGSSSLLRQGLVVIANVLINVHASKYGDSAVAGMSISGRIFILVISVMFGLGQGFQPVAGFCFGAKRYDKVKSAFNFTLIVSTILQLAFAFLLFRFSSEVITLFQKDAQVVKIGSEAVRFFAISLPFLPLSVIANMLFQICGQETQSIFLSSCRQGVFFLPLIIFLPHFWGLTGLELCQPIANILSGLVSIPFIIAFFRRFRYSKNLSPKKS